MKLVLSNISADLLKPNKVRCLFPHSILIDGQDGKSILDFAVADPSTRAVKYIFRWHPVHVTVQLASKLPFLATKEVMHLSHPICLVLIGERKATIADFGTG